MVCCITCLLASGIIISSIYFKNATSRSQVVQVYREQLPGGLKNIYDKISNERYWISTYGYLLGLVLSLVIILYNTQSKRYKLTNMSMVCLVVVVSFVTNYLYYMLSKKTDWMLNHINSPEQTRAWLVMYREMSYNCHMGLFLGIIGIGVLGYGFRC
jgi:Mn2+/Fe2+ NRAMP family transporter